MSSLTGAFLRTNTFVGSIPSEFGMLTNINSLRMAGNRVSGSLPSSLGNLLRARKLYFNDNLITGHIPTELGLLTHAERKYVSKHEKVICALTGISRIIFSATRNLSIGLKFYNNMLSGEFPSELGGLGSTLIHMDFQGNDNISGTMPAQLCNMTYFDCSELLCGCDCACLTE